MQDLRKIVQYLARAPCLRVPLAGGIHQVKNMMPDVEKVPFSPTEAMEAISKQESLAVEFSFFEPVVPFLRPQNAFQSPFSKCCST